MTKGNKELQVYNVMNEVQAFRTIQECKCMTHMGDGFD
jgi:hypothetical protein